MDKKILVAVDGSTFSYNALRYLCNLFTDLPGIHVHLYHVIPLMPLPPGHEWAAEETLIGSMTPQAIEKTRAAKRFMDVAALQLARLGIELDQVSSCIAYSRCGVAADILKEAQRGLYDALVVGRRGVTTIEEILFGSSTSSAVCKACCDIPVWVVDGKVDSRNFFLPVDETFNSLKAADHLGFILQDNPYAEITLYHFEGILPSSKPEDKKTLQDRWGEEWCRLHLERDDALYHAPEQILIDMGFPAERIRRRESSGLGTTSHIIKHSIHTECGTIVIGRRTRGLRKGILKGVSDRILKEASCMAIWIVG